MRGYSEVAHLARHLGARVVANSAGVEHALEAYAFGDGAGVVGAESRHDERSKNLGLARRFIDDGNTGVGAFVGSKLYGFAFVPLLALL